MVNTKWIHCSIIAIALLIGNANAQQDSFYYPDYLRQAVNDVLRIPWKEILRSGNDDWVVTHIYPSADNGTLVEPSVDAGKTGSNQTQAKAPGGLRIRGPLSSLMAGTADFTWLFVDRDETLEYQFEQPPLLFSTNSSIRWLSLHRQESAILFRVKGELEGNFAPYNDPRSLGRRRLRGTVYALPLEWKGKVAEALAYFAKNDEQRENIVESVKHENPLIAIGSVAMAERTFDDWLRCLRARKRWKTGDKRDKLVEQALLLGTLNSARRLSANQAADRRIKKIIMDLRTEKDVFWEEYKNERRVESIVWLVKRLVAEKGKEERTRSYFETLLKEPNLPPEATAILQEDYFRDLGLARVGRAHLLLADKIDSDRFTESVEDLAGKPWKHPPGMWRQQRQWAALMIKSKRGDDAAAEKLVEIFRGQPDLRSRLRGLSDIGWTRHPQAWNALAELVMSDERLLTTKGAPGTPVCWRAIRVMEIYVPGFSNGKTKPAISPRTIPSYWETIDTEGPFSYTEEDIERCREWVRRQPWFKE